jgi:hypothetical protein
MRERIEGKERETVLWEKKREERRRRWSLIYFDSGIFSFTNRITDEILNINRQHIWGWEEKRMLDFGCEWERE